MKTQIIIIISILSIIIIVSATYYSGETIEIPTGFEIVNCSITNSTYNLEGLDLNWSGENILISTSPHYRSDNLTISCLVIKEEKIIEKTYSSGSSGGGCNYNKNHDWECSEWSFCSNQIQERNCNKYNNCRNSYGRPISIRSCNSSESNKTKIEDIPEVIPEVIPDKSKNLLGIFFYWGCLF